MQLPNISSHIVYPSYNPQNNSYTPNPNKGFSIGTIEGQDLRIGDGELLRFLKSLF